MLHPSAANLQKEDQIFDAIYLQILRRANLEGLHDRIDVTPQTLVPIWLPAEFLGWLRLNRKFRLWTSGTCLHRCTSVILQCVRACSFLNWLLSWTMDDLPDDFAQYSEDYSDQHVNETYTDVAEVPRMDFWVNGVLHTIISVSGIISMWQPFEYVLSFVW